MRYLMCFLIFLPQLALAQSVLVRSGEHPNFSRLVMTFEAPLDWSLGRAGDGYRLRIEGSERRFDLSSVFDLIPRDRIARIDSEPQGLRLALGCNCNANAFEVRPGVLVVDIQDGPPGDDALFEAPIGEFPAAAISAASVQPKAINSGGDNEALATWPATQFVATPSGLDEVALPAPGSKKTPKDRRPQIAPPTPELPVIPPKSGGQQDVISGDPGRAEIMLPRDPDTRVVELRNQLVRQLARAASQGLIEVQVTPDTVRDTVPNARTSDLPRRTPANDLADHINFRTSTQIDRDRPRSSSAKPENTNGGTCYDTGLFEVSLWGDASDPLAGVAAARRNLILEFDRVDPAEALFLTQGYIYAGFGAEAASVLSQFGAEILDRDVLEDLSLLVDDAPIGPGSRIHGQISCDGPAALWAALAMKVLPRGASTNKSAILAAFSALPPHLRRHLGPALAEKFVDIGDLASAQAIRNAIARAESRFASGLVLLEAQLDKARGDTESALSSLNDVVARDDPNSPEALIRLMELKINLGEPIAEAMITSAVALIYEHRETTIAEDLAPLVVQALIDSKRFRSAIEVLGQLNATNPAEFELAGLWKSILSNLTEWAPDAEFLRLVFSDPIKSQLTTQQIEVRRQVADRLLQLRLPERAMALLPDPVQETPDKKRVANASLLMNDAERALMNLIGLQDPESVYLRDRARAIASTSNAKTTPNNSRRQSVEEMVEHKAFGAGSTKAEQAQPLVPPGRLPISLAEARARLQASRAAREAISEEVLITVNDPA